MRADPSQPPRHFVSLGQGPWLRHYPVSRRCAGLVCLVAVGVMVVAVGLILQASPFSERVTFLFWLFVGASGIAFYTVLLLLVLWEREVKCQYCPACLQFMRRGARVCPYCGLQEEQASASSAAPPRRPRLSA